MNNDRRYGVRHTIALLITLIIFPVTVLSQVSVPSFQTCGWTTTEISFVTGKLTFLRVNQEGDVFGGAGHELEAEVVVKLDSSPVKAYGFKLREGDNLYANQGMFQLLRDAYLNDLTVRIEYIQGKLICLVETSGVEPYSSNNNEIIRVIFEGKANANDPNPIPLHQ